MPPDNQDAENQSGSEWLTSSSPGPNHFFKEFLYSQVLIKGEFRYGILRPIDKPQTSLKLPILIQTSIRSPDKDRLRLSSFGASWEIRPQRSCM